MKLNYKSHGLTWLDLVPHTKEKEKRKMKKDRFSSSYQ